MFGGGIETPPFMSRFIKGFAGILPALNAAAEMKETE
jgi:hypothetical protein